MNNYNNKQNNENSRSKGMQYELDKMQELGMKVYIASRFKRLDYRLKQILDILNNQNGNNNHQQNSFKQNDNWDDNDFGIKEF